MCDHYLDSKYNDVDDEALMTKAFRTKLSSYSRLDDSDSYSCKLNFNKWRLFTNLRIPGLMFLLVLCGRQIRFGIHKDRSGNDIPDTLVNEGSFFRIGRKSGVMLDTLIGEGSFQTVDTEHMSDTLAVMFGSRSDFETKHSQIDEY